MLETIKDRALIALAWAGDAAHRRAVIGALAVLANHLFGWTNDPEMIAAIDVMLGVALGAWSSKKPNLEEVKEDAGIGVGE